jgi:hypothetical protein
MHALNMPASERTMSAIQWSAPPTDSADQKKSVVEPLVALRIKVAAELALAES